MGYPSDLDDFEIKHPKCFLMTIGILTIIELGILFSL